MSELEKLEAGDKHYKAYVGPPLKYDLLGALQFTLLTSAGLRADHKLVDIGCGSLRAGKMLIPYLNSGNYFGIDPNQWLIDEAIDHELGQSLVDLKAPRFNNSANFEIGLFNEQFDFAIAQSIFSHASAVQIRTCLREVCQTLKPEGLFLATFIWGKDNYQEDEWVYPGCVSYKPNTIKDWAWKDCGLKMQETNWPHPNGQNWAIFFSPGQENRVEKLSKFSLSQYEADTIAIPEEVKGGLLGKVKSKVRGLVK